MNKLILGIIFLFVSMIRLPAADALALIGYTEPVSKQDDIMKVWITAASSTQIEYKTTPQSLNRNRIKRSEVKSVYFFEPPIFKEAEELYSAGWLESAFHIAVSENKRSWRYIAGILRRWAAEGKYDGKSGRHPQKDNRQKYLEDYERRWGGVSR